MEKNRDKRKEWILIYGVIFIGALINIISVIKKFINHSYVEVNSTFFWSNLFLLLILMFLIINRYWRLGVIFLITSVILTFFSQLLNQTGNSYSIFLIFVSFLVLFPSLFFCYKFYKSNEHFRVRGGEINDAFSFKLIRILIALVIIGMIFWFLKG